MDCHQELFIIIYLDLHDVRDAKARRRGHILVGHLGRFADCRLATVAKVERAMAKRLMMMMEHPLRTKIGYLCMKPRGIADYATA